MIPRDFFSSPFMLHIKDGKSIKYLVKSQNYKSSYSNLERPWPHSPTALSTGLFKTNYRLNHIWIGLGVWNKLQQWSLKDFFITVERNVSGRSSQLIFILNLTFPFFLDTKWDEIIYEEAFCFLIFLFTRFLTCTLRETKYIKIGEKSWENPVAYFQNAPSEMILLHFKITIRQTSRQTAIFILCPTLWIIFKIKYILREIHCCAAGVIHQTNSSLSSFRIMLWTTVQWDFFF